MAAGYTERGVPTSAEQILITSGTQQALDLVLRLSVPAGAHVLVETPTYPNALAALSARRARISTHGLDTATGWDGEMLLGALRQTRPRLSYVIPEFQNLKEGDTILDGPPGHDKEWKMTVSGDGEA